MSFFTKIILLAAIVNTMLPAINAQPVQSFCSGPTSLQNQYIQDAWYVAYDFQMHSDSLNMTNTLDIPSNVKDDVLACLLAVYNADLPARDTVIQKFNIHAYRDIDLHQFEMYLDTSHAWTHQILQNNCSSTGNVYMDSLAARYGFQVEFVQIFPDWVEDFDALVRIKTSEYVNTDYLSKVLLGLQGVKFANPFTFGGDGNRIFYTPRDSFSEITFRHGWEDCPAGCVQHRDWLFRVYEDCSVEFISSYGDVLTPIRVLPQVSFTTKIYPNPANELLNIEMTGLEGDMLQLQAFGMDGSQVLYDILPVYNGNLNQTLDLSTLLSGVYNLTLTNSEQVYSQKIIVIK
jgi:Secretion system C-terminal sorting domain